MLFRRTRRLQLRCGSKSWSSYKAELDLGTCSKEELAATLEGFMLTRESKMVESINEHHIYPLGEPSSGELQCLERDINIITNKMFARPMLCWTVCWRLKKGRQGGASWTKKSQWWRGLDETYGLLWGCQDHPWPCQVDQVSFLWECGHTWWVHFCQVFYCFIYCSLCYFLYL